MRKSLLLLAGGIIIGMSMAGLGSYFWGRHQSSDSWKSVEAVHLLEQAHWANYIRTGHLDEYYQKVEASFLASVPRVHAYGMNTEFGKSALWAVQEYYRDNNLSVPQQLKPILDSLPARTEGKRFAESQKK